MCCTDSFHWALVRFWVRNWCRGFLQDINLQAQGLPCPPPRPPAGVTLRTCKCSV